MTVLPRVGSLLMVLFVLYLMPALSVCGGEEGLLHAWDLGRLLVPESVSGRTVAIEGGCVVESDPLPALRFDGVGTRITVPGMTAGDLPKRDITVEATVALEAPERWGGLLGYVQDNGDYEKGWLLGYVNDHFCFAVSTAGTLTYMEADSAAVMGRWYHVAGVYDGSVMRLYVNGRLAAESTDQKGDIDYPPTAYYTIGAYRDDNENYLFKGRLHAPRVYGIALDADTIREHVRPLEEILLTPVAYQVPPRVSFPRQGAAQIRLNLQHPASALVETRAAGGAWQATAWSAAATDHVVDLDGLLPDTEYAFRIRTRQDADESISPLYSFDTTFNTSPPPVAAGGPEVGFEDELARSLVADLACPRGVCVVYGVVDGRLALALARHSEYRIIGFAESEEALRVSRQRLLEAGAYGARVTVHRVDSLAALPTPSGMADGVVSESVLAGEMPGTAAEVYRLLRPDGGKAVLAVRRTGEEAATAPAERLRAWFAAGSITPDRLTSDAYVTASLTRGPLPGAGAWTHQYGDAGNTANSYDALLGATGTGDMQVQWLGRPGGDFGIDRNPRMPAPLAVRGMLFHQGMNRLAALNAFNGTLLWNLELPALRRVNMPRDASNWCADENSLYVAMAGCCLQLDLATGAEKTVYTVPGEGGDPRPEWGTVMRSGTLLIGSSVSPGGHYTEYWGGAAWYDAKDGADAAKVCGTRVFAYDLSTQPVQLAWQRPGVAIVESTISACAGRLYYLEGRAPALAGTPVGRVGNELWDDLWLVALDLRTGNLLWERPAEIEPAPTVLFLSVTPSALVISGSGAGVYRLYAHSPADGSRLWKADHPWLSDNHSGHMQHPVLVADTVYLEPHAYDLMTGTRHPGSIGRHEGCATYAGTQNALIYRGQARRVAMWDMKTGAVSSWLNLRPSCWLSTIPGNGLLLAPEGGAGCSCGNWLETSLGFAPIALDRRTQP